MADQIYIGNFAKGLTEDRLPFNIDNDAFPTMFNFYSWRGRAKRKRGTSFLGRLQRQVQSVLVTPLPWQYGPLVLVSGAGNLITGFSLQSTSSITQGTISFVVGGQTYTEPATPDGSLIGSGGGSGTINYATGNITIVGGGVGPLIGLFSYFPGLPVLGLEDYVPNTADSQFPLLLSFDTTYAYQINQASTPFFYDVSYYKGTNNPVVWSNGDFAQFWSTNYQSAFWVTNNKPGFHFVNGTYTSGTGTTSITFNFKSVGVNFTTLVVGDVLFFNEWPLTTTINGINGTVSSVAGAAAGNYVVTFPSIVTVSGTGIAQLITNSIPGQDGIRWYDGDPTSGTGIPTGTGLGWVNFSPPLTAATIGINDQIPALYYLVGALAILPFKDRLLFFGPQIQSSTGPVIQRPLQDTVLWSWNGTPYYNPLVPTNTTGSETYDVTSYYVDQTGKGGYLPAGISMPIVTVMDNEDVLLIGFGGGGKKTRFVYTGNDLQPFLFYLIDSQYASSSTFSGVVLDKAGLEVGTYGITATTQQMVDRIDLQIPDEVFEIQALNNGQKRVNAIRDLFRQWIYFSYPTGDGNPLTGSWVFPSQTFLFNYRDNTWAILRENFTHHGTYRKSSHYTWATLPFPTWNDWREPWNSGSQTALFPSIVAGNPQGFVLIKDQGTGEGRSGAIQGLSDNGLGFTQVTSFNHCVNSESSIEGVNGDYLFFQNSIGTTTINNQIGMVTETIDANNFVVDIPFDSGTYLGLGTYARLIQPLLQTKQFPVYWEEGRQVRLGVQKYLLDRTAEGQVTININLSQDPETPWNEDPQLPNINTTNNALIYSQLLYTCPESTNLGLTPSNVNLQTPTAINAATAGNYQLWHRMNTSLQGDSVQIGITLSDTQMRNLTIATSEIALHAIQLTVHKGPILI